MMILIFSLLCVSTINADHHDGHHDHHHEEHIAKTIKPVQVDVYYESLCPDSKQFINKQLYPALSTDLAKHINLTVYPYGKSTARIENAKPQFTCHHGPYECDGNIYHSCALELINGGKPTEGLSYNKDALAYVNCMMDKIYQEDGKSKSPIDQCSSLLGSSSNDIKNCATSDQGKEFLSNYGRLTDEFQKPLKSVPTIVFNKKYDAGESKAAYEDFKKALCKEFEDSKPTECSKNGGSGTQPLLAVITIVLAVVKLL